MYNEYISKEGKVLFNINNFTWGNKILSQSDLSNYLIELDKDIAKKYQEEYNNKVKEINEEQNNSTIDNIDDMETYGIILNDDGTETNTIEESINNKIKNIKLSIISEIISNGYGTFNNFTIIKH